MNFIVFILGIISSLIAFWQSTRVLLWWDYSYYIENTFRVYLGQIPYKDFVLVVMPGTYYVGALIMKVFGTSYIFQKAYMILITFFTLILTYQILQLIKRDPKLNIFLLLPVVIAGNYAFFSIPSYDKNPILCSLLAIYLILKAHKSKVNIWRQYFFIGITLALPIFFKQNTGWAFFTFFSILLHIDIFVLDKQHKEKKIFFLYTGILLIILPFVFYLISVHSVFQFIYQTALYPLKVRQLNVRIISTLYDVVRPRAILYYIPFILAALFVVKKKINNIKLLLIVVYGIILSPAVYVLCLFFMLRNKVQDFAFLIGYTILYNTSIWFVLYFCLFLVLSYELIKRKIKNRFFFIFIACIVLFSLSLLSLHTVERATPTIYPYFAIMLLCLSIKLKEIYPKYHWKLIAIIISIGTTICLLFILLSIDIIQLGVSLKLFNATGEIAQQIKTGTYVGSIPGEWTGEMDQMIKYVNLNISLNDTIITIPGEDPIYYLTKRVPPLPFFEFLEYSCPFNVEQYASLIEAKKIDWIIVKNDLQCGYKCLGADIDNLTNRLKVNYILVKQLKGYDIYKRISIKQINP